MNKNQNSKAFHKLLVKELALFTDSQFQELERKSELSISFSQFSNRCDIVVAYFEEPLYQELITIFNYSSRVCSFHLKMNFLYNVQSLYKLLSQWFNQFSFQEDEDSKQLFSFKENHLLFEFPQLILKAENDIYEKFFKTNLKNLQDFLEYLFGYKKLLISVLKVEDSFSLASLMKNIPEPVISQEDTITEYPEEPIPPEEEPIYSKPIYFEKESIRRGAFQLYFIESVEQYSFRRQASYKLGFTNFSEQYYLVLGTKFVSPQEREKFLELLEVDKWFEIEFKLEPKDSSSSRILQNYDGWLLNCLSIDLPKNTLIKDDSSNKLFSLNVYTKYSSFDGLFSVEEWAKLFASLGHKVLALTDFNNVHSFPDAEKSAKKYGLKPLYGAEMEIISEKLQIISNLHYLPSNTEIIFSIFDLETTGLNPLFDEVIEIYIAKYNGGIVLNHYHAFLKCDRELSEEIINLTSITAETLDKLGREKVQVFKEVKEFVDKTILMAHNGSDFDLPFLNAQFRKAGLEPLELPLLDTLILAKALDDEKKKSKSFSLSAVAKKNSINVVDQKWHSSEYDTNCLVALWKNWEKKLTEMSLDPYVYENLENLNNAFNQNKLLVNYFGTNVIIFAKNQKGLESLYELVSKAHIENFSDKPRLQWSSIGEKDRENLIFLSSPTNSLVLNALFKDDFLLFKKEGEKLDYLSLPPPSHFLHEINRGHYSLEEVQLFLKKFYDWSKKCNFKLLANYCLKFKYYQEIEQYKALVHAKNIGGKRHPLFSNKSSNEILPDYSFRTTDKIIEEFSFLELTEEEKQELFFKYREEIIKSISSDIQVSFSTLSLPLIPGSLENIKKYTASKLEEKYGSKPDAFLQTTLYRELSGIKENGYDAVYWCAHLLVKRSKAEGFLVGSRGSVGSSFLAHILEISEVNPLPPHYYCNKCSYFQIHESFKESGFDLEPKKCPNCACFLFTDGQNIPFETFLGLERKKVPDIDLNFSGRYQQKAHNFLRELFGQEYTFRTGTISAVAEKTSFALARNYLQDNNIEFNKGKLHWLANRLKDVKRTTGQHPGGIIVIPRGDSIYKYTPVNYPANDSTSEWLTTHFEKDALKDSLFKFDILGQDDPTTLALLSEFTGVNLEKITYTDKDILKMFSDITVLSIPQDKLEILGETVGTLGLPEFGTEKTREIVKACKSRINNFSDLIRISGISHGKNVWKNNIEKLMEDKNLSLTDVITCRDDIMNYLLEKKISIEKSFRITESVRRGYGIPKEDLPLLKKSGVPDWYIECANKITYIFPKAHATAYVLMCWKIAFFKLHYPVEFYAAYFTITNKHFDIETLMTNDLINIKKKYRDGKVSIKSKSNKENVEKTKYLVMIYEVALEMIARGIKFRMIDLNESLANTFKPDTQTRTILMPFSSVDGLGDITASQLEEERNKKGKYSSREELEERVKLNVKILKLFESLKIIEPKQLLNI